MGHTGLTLLIAILAALGNTSLHSLAGQQLEAYPLASPGPSEAPADALDLGPCAKEWLLAVLKLATSHPYEALENLSLERISVEGGEIVYTYRGAVRGVDVTLVVTSNGRFRLETSLPPATADGCMGTVMIQLAPAASCAGYIVRESSPGVFEPVIDGIPVEPPIRVSCAVPRNGFYARMVEGFLPPVDPSHPLHVYIDDHTELVAAEVLACRGQRPPSAADIRVESISYQLVDRFLAPVLTLDYNGTKARMALLPSGPKPLDAPENCSKPRSLIMPWAGLVGLGLSLAALHIYKHLRARKLYVEERL